MQNVYSAAKNMDWKKLRKWSVMVSDKSHGMGCLQRARDWLRAVLCAICWLPEVWKTMCHIVVDFSIVFRLRSAEMKQCTCILSLWQHYLDSCMTDTPLCTLPSVCLYLTLGHQIKEDDMMPKRQKKGWILSPRPRRRKRAMVVLWKVERFPNWSALSGHTIKTKHFINKDAAPYLVAAACCCRHKCFVDTSPKQT